MPAFKDLTGQKFGRLTVIRRVENNKHNQIQWLCRCDCDEKEVTIRGCELRTGNTKSCGCLLKRYNTYDLTGEYGIGYTSNTNEPFYFDLEDYDRIKDYCWSKGNFGYIITAIHKNIILMHRLIMNCPKDMEVDHIYHVNHDNRKSELRIVTRSQNQMNRKIFKNNTSGVKGVNWEKFANKWRAQIKIKYNKIHLGLFDNFEDAVKARKEAEVKYFGEYNYK